MCRMSALAATALALALTSVGASPALAFPFGKGADKAPAAEKPAAAAPAPRKATAQERAQIARLDPLARAAFWAHEAELDPNDVDAGVKLSQALRQMGNYGDALQAAQAAAERRGESLSDVIRRALARYASTHRDR